MSVTPAVLPPTPDRSLRTAPLIPVDGSLAQFARDTCVSVAELGCLAGAVLAVLSTETDEIQVLSEAGDGALGHFVARGGAEELMRTALDGAGFAQTRDEVLVAAAAPAGRLLVVLLGQRSHQAPLDSGGVRQLFESAVRVAALSLCDRMRLLERQRRQQAQQQTRLACALHDDVVQRLFGLSLILDAEEPLAADLRAVCSTEVEQALADVRTIISSQIDTEPGETASFEGDLRTTLEAFGEQGAEIDATLDDLRVLPAQQAIACSVVNEAMRNVRKHAVPTCVRITVRQTDEVLLVTVFNDGVRDEGRGRRSPRGVGLQLAATEAALGGGVLERGPVGLDSWAVRLTLPLEERDDYCDYAGAGAGGASGG